MPKLLYGSLFSQDLFQCSKLNYWKIITENQKWIFEIKKTQREDNNGNELWKLSNETSWIKNIVWNIDYSENQYKKSNKSHT